MTPTPSELSARAAVLKNTIRDLTAKRAAHAPLAVNGDARGPQARVAIAAIDTERAAAISELETIEQALRSPEVRLAGLEQRLDDQFEYRLPDLRTQLRNMLRTQYEQLASHRTLDATGFAVAGLIDPDPRGIADPRSVRLADLPHAYAAMLTKESEDRAELVSFEGRKEGLVSEARQAGTSLDLLKAQEQRLRMAVEIRARHTQQLLDSTTLPDVPERLNRFL